MTIPNPTHVPNDEFIHPEIKEGEVLLRNLKRKQCELLIFTTKRMGKYAYDGRGNRLFAADWYPVFIEESELQATKQTLREWRKEFQLGEN